MSRYHSYLNSTKEILKQYSGEEPFSTFVKKFFSVSKKYGSRDRKQISQLCYGFFRLGKVVMNTSAEEKILLGLFLCSNESNELLKAFKPEWDEKIKLPIHEKLLHTEYQFLIKEIFPWSKELSGGIDFEKFCISFFIQPDLFIRLRPGKEKLAKEKLIAAGIVFKSINDNCLALPNASKIDSVLEIDKEAVIQDLSSQKVGKFLAPALASCGKDKPSVWDCCAGSGGKAMMAFDLSPKISLTVSDMRESIIANLKKRFQQAGIKSYTNQLVDLASENYRAGKQQYDLIIADVPCTGSGTWSRTPEQLYYFSESKIEKYAKVQKQIVSNVMTQLKEGGSFLYITCSVFKKENEEIAGFIEKKFKLQLVNSSVIKGYDNRADSMYIALFNS